MMMTRRSILRALGASAMAPVVAPFAQACMGQASPARNPGPPTRRATDDIRAQLRATIATLSQRYPYASALAAVRRRGRAAADAGEHGADHDLAAALVLELSDGAHRFEQATTDLSERGIAGAAELLRAQAAAGYQSIRPSLPLAGPRDFATEPVVDPALGALAGDAGQRPAPWPAAWIDRVRELYERARRVGGSRVVYRGAYLTADDCTTLFVGRGRDLEQRLVRARAGVVLVAQRGARAGAEPVAEIAEQSGLMGLEAADVPPVQLDAAAERVLALVTPAPPPTGDTELILGPTVSALIARQCVGKALQAHHWVSGEARAAAFLNRPVGSDRVTVVDDPGAEGAYGSYFFDDQGHPAAATVLIDRGTLAAPVTDEHSAALLGLPRTANARRLTPLHPVGPRLSNIAFAGGEATRDELVSAVRRGLLLEGALAARADLRTWRFTARVARAYEIVDGRLTGVLYGNVDIRGDVPQLLQAVRGATAATHRAAAGADLAATMAGPYLLTRAEVL